MSAATNPSPFWRGALVVSLVANVAMAFVLLQRDEPAEKSETRLHAVNRLEGKIVKPLTAIKKTNTTWATSIASDDFATLEENLTAFGVPDQVLKDMLLPEINHKYQRQMAAAYVGQAERYGMTWKPDPGWDEWIPRKRFSGIEEERKLVVVSVFGELVSDSEEEETFRHRINVHDNAFASLDPKLKEQVDQDGEERLNIYKDMRKLEPRPTEDEISAAVAKKRQEQLARLKANFPAEQFEDYTLRHSAFTRIPREMPGIDFTPDEMREIVRQFENHKAANDFTAAMAKIQDLLGEDRFATFEPEARKQLEKIKSR